MSHILHTIRRNDIYHFNIRLGQKVYRKSLKTDSPKQARAYVYDIIQFIKKNKGIFMEVDKQEIDNFINNLLSNKLNEIVRLTNAITDPCSASANLDFKKWYNINEEQIRHNYNTSNYIDTTGIDEPINFTNWIANKVNELAKENSLHSYLNQYEEYHSLDEVDPTYETMSYPTVHRHRYEHLNEVISKQAIDIAKAIEKNNNVRLRLEIEDLKTKYANLIPTSTLKHNNQSEVPSESDALNFNDVKNEYFEYCNKIGYKKINERKSHLEAFLTEIGLTKIKDITLEEVEVMFKTLLNLPRKSNTNSNSVTPNPYKNKSLQERWEAAKYEDIDVSWLYTTSSIRKHRTSLLDFISWLIDNKKAIEPNHLPSKDSLTKKLTIPNDRNTPRSAFLDEQVSNIINYCKARKDEPMNIAILIMVYQGMRNSEVTNLSKSDIIIDPETNIHYIYVRKGKTKSAQRKIPIHRELVMLGLWDFAQETNKLVFDFASEKLTRHYFKVIKPALSIPDTAADGGTLSLYSLRHSFVTKLARNNTNEAFRKYLVGHSDVTQGYTHLDNAVGLTDLQREINKLKYK